MEDSEIFARIDALHLALVGKLGKQPYINTSLDFEVGGRVTMAIWGLESKIIHCSKGESAHAVLCDAEAFVAAMPDAEQLQKRQWHRKLADVIDEGHALSLPDDVMQPLRASSQAMTKNLLAHDPA